MKQTKYIVLLSVLLLSKVVWGQTVQIPDEAFKTCLADKKPNVLDASQNLIIAQAKNASGLLSCRGYNISSIEGIQYFEKIKEIDFSSNNITSIGSFAPSDSLLRIRINDNQLTSLPDINNLPQLRTLEIKRNELQSLPDLSSIPFLIQLYVEGNQLTSIPNLSNLKNLYAVNVSNNSLTSFPEMDTLKNLVEIKAENNQLNTFPSLEKLPALQEVFLAGNNLSDLPRIATDNQIKTIDIKNNQFSSLPDFTVFPKLERAFLNNNELTFQDLISLTAIQGYDTIFPLQEQQLIHVGKTYEVRKNDPLTLNTGVDTSVPEVRYSWIYNGTLIQNSESDQLKAKTDTTTNTGYYYAVLTHPSFPDLTIETDSFYVQVNPCFIHQDIEIQVTPKTCKNNGGQIEVSTRNPLPNGFEYQLKAIRISQEFYSEEGLFINLEEARYQLYGAVDNCRESISSVIEIEEEDCNDVYITLDGDGNNDVYFINEEGGAKIYDKFGNVVADLKLPDQWDGRSNGQKVAPGLYYININDGEKVLKITVLH